MKKKMALVALLIALIASPGAEALIATTHPGSTAGGYTSPVFVSPRGTSLTYANFDVDVHDIRSDDRRDSGSAPFCALFPQGACPLFYSEAIGLGEVTRVHGTELLDQGTYGFYCSLHTWMTGTLLVGG